MGQTQGGNAGNLELLKQMEEQRAEIEALKEKQNFKQINGNNITIWHNSTVAFLKIDVSGLTIKAGSTNDNVIATLPANVSVDIHTRSGVLMTSAWVPTDVVMVGVESTTGGNIYLRCSNARENAVFSELIVVPGKYFHVLED